MGKLKIYLHLLKTRFGNWLGRMVYRRESPEYRGLDNYKIGWQNHLFTSNDYIYVYFGKRLFCYMTTCSMQISLENTCPALRPDRVIVSLASGHHHRPKPDHHLFPLDFLSSLKFESLS